MLVSYCESVSRLLSKRAATLERCLRQWTQEQQQSSSKPSATPAAASKAVESPSNALQKFDAAVLTAPCVPLHASE